MRKNSIRLLFLLSVAFLMQFTAGLCAIQAASNSGGFSVSPAFQEVEILQSDDKKEFFIKISNNTGNIQEVNLEAVDFENSTEPGQIIFPGDQSSDFVKKYGLVSWIKLEKNVIVLNPNSEEKISFTIENRDTLSPGGHYVSIMATVGGKINESISSSVGLKQSIASLVFVKKIGGEIYSMELKKITVPKVIFSLPEKINLEFENTGNIHVVPRGTIEIFSPFGKILGKGVINRDSAKILPGTIKNGNHKIDNYSALFFPGRYKIRINYRYDGEEKFTQKETVFSSLGSIWIDSVVLLTIIAISAIVTSYVVKNRRKKALNKLKNNQEKQS